MKKLIMIISGVSIAAFIGFGNTTLAAENDEGPDAEGDEVQAEDHNSTRSNVSSVKEPGDEDGDDIPKGSGDPLKGLNVTSCKNYPKGKCPTVNKPDDGEDDDSRKKKKDEDG